MKQESWEGKVKRQTIDVSLANDQVGPGHLGKANSCAQAPESQEAD